MKMEESGQLPGLRSLALGGPSQSRMILDAGSRVYTLRENVQRFTFVQGSRSNSPASGLVLKVPPGGSAFLC